MNLFASVALVGWIPVVFLLFAWLPAQRAALICFLGGWLFLPVAEFRIAGLPDYTKLFAVCVLVFLAIAIFDFRGLLTLRPSWADGPILLFCLSPFFSSIFGGLGTHEGLSVVFNQVVVWLIPYCVGTLYFKNLSGLRTLAVGFFAGGLIYVPLCIFEILSGPKLHLLIYGFAQSNMDPTVMRFGGWRPVVFMNSGLTVAVWMASSSVIGIWLLRARLLRSIAGIRPIWFVSALVLTTLWLKSVNGWFLLLLGTTLLFLTSRWRNKALAYLTIILIPAYVLSSAAGLRSREQLIPIVKAVLNEDRAESLEFRFRNERVISANARERPILGWGRTNSVYADRDRVIHPPADKGAPSFAVIDSLWISVFAAFGAIGLAGFLGSLLLPVALFLWRFPGAQWQSEIVAPAAALAIALLMYSIDHLANGFINPIFMLVAGGLAHCSLRRST